jgi:hypothetical protein
MSSAIKPLSEKPLGYVLSVLGGLLGGPLGLIASPAVLFGLGKVMKGASGKTPNRFLAWAAVGVVGAPLCWVPIISQSDVANQGSGSEQVRTADRGGAVIPLGTVEAVRGDRSLGVTGSREFSSISVSNQFMDPVASKGGRLVAVYLTIKNTGKESGDMSWTRFRLKDSEDRTYDAISDFSEITTISMWTEEQGLASPGDQLFPGGTANTVAVFRVAPDATGLRLNVNQNTFAIE